MPNFNPTSITGVNFTTIDTGEDWPNSPLIKGDMVSENLYRATLSYSEILGVEPDIYLIIGN